MNLRENDTRAKRSNSIARIFHVLRVASGALLAALLVHVCREFHEKPCVLREANVYPLGAHSFQHKREKPCGKIRCH
jgi:hypothetical protein